MTVAVLDTGIDLTHPAFTGKLVPGYDFVDNDDNPSEVGVTHQGAYGHGTHVAGIIALTAPNAKIMPIRILDSNGEGELWRVTAAIIWAAQHGAKIINISFGYNSDPRLLHDLLDVCEGVPTADGKRFPELNGNQLIVISGAGNGGNGNPIYPSGNRIDPQLGVGAINRFDNLTDFTTMSVGRSGTERFIRSIAPGENIVSTLPGGRYGVWSGTSMAAPIVSGIAALIRSLDPTSVPHLVVGRISDTGIQWDCTHPTRGEIKTSRVDAYCAVSNNTSCGVPRTGSCNR